MRILTASWFMPLPDGHIRIGISRGVPRRGLQPGFRMYRKLQPGPWFDSTDTAAFTELYHREVLHRLDPQRVLEELQQLADGKIPVLCCFERVGGPIWCHRAQAASWLAEGLGEPVPEIGFEHLPQDQHPLRPPERERDLLDR